MPFQLCSFGLNSMTVLFGLICLLSLMPNYRMSSVPINQPQCKCIVNTMDYGRDFGFVQNKNELTKEAMELIQEYIGLNKTGDFNDETCLFVNNRFQQNIISWRFKNLSKKLSKQNQQFKESLEFVFEMWSKITDLIFTNVDNSHAEIQVTLGSDEINCKDGRNLTDSGGVLFGCAFLPGDFKNGGDVYFYGSDWYPRQEVGLPYKTEERNILPAAIHAFGYAIGLTNSTYNPKCKPEIMFNDYCERITESNKLEIKKIYNPQSINH